MRVAQTQNTIPKQHRPHHRTPPPNPPPSSQLVLPGSTRLPTPQQQSQPHPHTNTRRNPPAPQASTLTTNQTPPPVPLRALRAPSASSVFHPFLPPQRPPLPHHRLMFLSSRSARPHQPLLRPPRHLHRSRRQHHPHPQPGSRSRSPHPHRRTRSIAHPPPRHRYRLHPRPPRRPPRHSPRPIPRPSSQTPHTATRARVLRAVEDCIQRETDPPEATRLHAELRERLDTESFDIDIRTRPVEDVIQDIIRDVGFDRICGTHPYKRRTPADLALLETTAAAPKGQAANPAHTPTWRPFPADEDDGLPQILQSILNPTRFRGK